MRERLNQYGRTACAALIIVSAFQLSGHSQSIFSSYGIGELRYFINSRSAGMGGVGLTMPDNTAPNLINPALMIELDQTSFSAGVRYEGVRFEHSGISTTSQLSALNNISLVIKWEDSFAFGVGVRPFTDTDYKVVYPAPEVTRRLNGSGGTSSAYGGLSFKIKERISAGISYVILFGKDTEQWRIEFDDNTYTDSFIESRISKWGDGISVGLKYDVTDGLSLGGVYVSEISLKHTNRYTFTDEKDLEEEGGTGRIPYSFGAGMSYALSERLTFSTDIYRWQMKGLSMSWLHNTNFRNSTRLGAGIEVRPAERPGVNRINRMAYRLGFYHWDLYSRDTDGSPLSEKFITAGIGIPFYNNRARMDIALEGGFRSSSTKNIGSEKIFRLHVDISGNEHWFVRQQP